MEWNLYWRLLNEVVQWILIVYAMTVLRNHRDGLNTIWKRLE